MTNPFEKDDEMYLVLINEEAQYSLWPSFIDVPRGWNIVLPASSRQQCLDYVNEHWTDMRPKSLALEMSADAQERTERQLTATHSHLQTEEHSLAIGSN
jgi:MbtH protein